MIQKQKICCNKNKNSQGLGAGLLWGIFPHSFCLMAIFFSTIGAITLNTFFKKILLINHFFEFLISISLLLATLTCVIYLKKNQCFCRSKIKSKWRYILTVYSTTILTNLLFFFIVLPILVNAQNSQNPKILNTETNLSQLSLEIQLPCTGHATLISDEIKQNFQIENITFNEPNVFSIIYDPTKTSPDKILESKIFQTYPAKIISKK